MLPDLNANLHWELQELEEGDYSLVFDDLLSGLCDVCRQHHTPRCILRKDTSAQALGRPFPFDVQWAQDERLVAITLVSWTPSKIGHDIGRHCEQ